MRKSISLKILLRAPLKTLLTFLLVAAASFALFSRVTDYAVTTREAAKAKNFYSGVAALDNSVEMFWVNDTPFWPDPKPWPKDEKLEEFSSLPGVTLTDKRYITDGLVEDYKRVIDEDNAGIHEFIVEGTYDGYDEYGEAPYEKLYLNFNDVKVHAGDIVLDDRYPMQVCVQFLKEEEENEAYKQPFSRKFFYGMEKGSRYLVHGTYSQRTGTAFELDLYEYTSKESLCVIDGLGDNYLETKDFAWYKGMIEAINQSLVAYDIVYTSDMRAVPYVSERGITVSQGQYLTSENTDGCVVSQTFLETYGLSVGDKIHIELGDMFMGGGALGARLKTPDILSEFIASADLEIIGAYQYNDDPGERLFNEWSFGPGTIFVASSLLPIEVPDDYELSMRDFSVLIEDPQDIEAFREAAELMAADMGLALYFSDGGWSDVKDNIETGSLSSFLATVLYVLGAALALLLAVYLYIGRSKESYAVMRTLGVSSKKAGNSITLPFLLLSVFAMVIGGAAGLFYASYTVAGTLTNMSNSSAPEGYVYVLDAALPVGVVILCLLCELLFSSFVTLLFLRKMRKTSPLELLQEGMGGTGAAKRAGILRSPYPSAKHTPEVADTAPVPAGLDMSRLAAVENISAPGRYHAFDQVCAYILRHMKRGFGKTAVSLVLTVVLTAGIGTFVLAKLTYHDICRETAVPGRATEFSSTAVQGLIESDLLKDIYYYGRFDVRVNGTGHHCSITFTNSLDKYLIKDYKITYAEGYDSSIFEGTGPVCLVEQSLAETLGVGPGDEITMMSDDLYKFMPRVYEADKLEAAIERAGKPYKVVGILETEDEDRGAGIFTVVNEATQGLYGQPFSVGYCEFTLTDNGKLTEAEELLEGLKKKGIEHARMASFHIDTEPLKNARRIRDLLDSLFPIAVAAAVLIGLFGPGLLIIQSAQEAAFLRILGVTKKRARCMLMLEQIILCIAGLVLVAGILVLFSPGRFVRSVETLAVCWALYLLGGVCGAFAAAVQVTRHRVLELLQVKE